MYLFSILFRYCIISFYSASISEGTPVGQSVVQVKATDADAGSNAEITYKIISGDNRGIDI